jgi:hypothetical protein
MYHSRYHPETRIRTREIGLYEHELVIPGHTLGPSGWRDSPNHTYLEQGLEPETRVNLPTDTDDYNQETVSSLFEAFQDVAHHERALPIIAWFYAAPLRPLVEDFSDGVGFHHISVTYDKEDPTRFLLAALCRSFGMSGQPYSVTPFDTLVEVLSATNGVPVWFHGYDPNELTNDQLVNVHRQLERASTVDVILVPGINDRTDIHLHRSPCVLSGEQPLQDSTARRWVIETDLDGEAGEVKNRLVDLFGDARPDTEYALPRTVPSPNQHALAYYRFLTSLNTETVCAAWQWAREQTHRILSKQSSVNGVDGWDLKGVQTVAFGFEMQKRFSESLDELSSPLKIEALNNALNYLIYEKTRI